LLSIEEKEVDKFIINYEKKLPRYEIEKVDQGILSIKEQQYAINKFRESDPGYEKMSDQEVLRYMRINKQDPRFNPVHIADQCDKYSCSKNCELEGEKCRNADAYVKHVGMTSKRELVPCQYNEGLFYGHSCTNTSGIYGLFPKSYYFKFDEIVSRKFTFVMGDKTKTISLSGDKIYSRMNDLIEERQKIKYLIYFDIFIIKH